MTEKTVAAEQHTPAKQHKPSTQRSGSSGTFLAMVIALAAAGGSYYVWQQYLIAEQDRQALAQSITRLLDVVEEKDRVQLARIEQLQQHHHDELEQHLMQLEQSLPDLSQQLSRQQRNWSLAEVDYLLRLADQRLQLSHDVPTAITALGQAREQLLHYNGDHFSQVIAAMERSIQQLSVLEQQNSSQINARLSTRLATLDELPFALHAEAVSTSQPPPQAVAKDARALDKISYWGRLVWHDIKSLVTIRRSDEVARPLMNPEQRYFLRAQLRLKLETARLAAMGHNQPLYQASLTEAAAWISRYYDLNDEAVIQTRAALTQLAQLNVDPELPSLQPLRQQLHAGRTPAATVAQPHLAPGATAEEPAAESQP